MILKSKILFITEGEYGGANKHILKIAEVLQQKRCEVQVLLRKRSDHNSLTSSLTSNIYRDDKLGDVILENGSLEHLKTNPKYLFFTNELPSYQKTEIILKHLKFIPDYIFVGIIPNFLTATDIAKLAKATKAMVYNVALDMSHFTGGCHFAWDCIGYIKGCDKVKCPAILDEKYYELARENFSLKKQSIANGNFNILAGTQWTKKQAKKSYLYKNQSSILNISGIVDTEVFNPSKRGIAKTVFNLSEKKFYILTGSENTRDKRKGYTYFITAMQYFWEMLSEKERKKIVILSVTKSLTKAHTEIPFQKHRIDYVRDERMLSLLYQASDMYINTSIEDSGPAMLIEALACGTPVVSFNMGAAEEFIVNNKTGFIVENKNAKALAEAIKNIYNAPLLKRTEMAKEGQELVLKKGSIFSALKVFGKILYQKNISVAMCTYNGEKYIAEQIDSILKQEYSVSEIIICDDGSTDNTIKIIENYQQKYKSIIQLVKNPTNLGVTKNFEKAINLCSGHFIFLSDQDDIWLPEKTKEIVNFFMENEEQLAVFHDLKILKKDGNILKKSMWDSLSYTQKVRDNISLPNFLLLFGNVVTGMAMAIQKPSTPVILNNEGGIDFLHDYLLALNYITENKISPLNKCLGYYRQHSQQQLGYSEATSNLNYFKCYKNPYIRLRYLLGRVNHLGKVRHIHPQMNYFVHLLNLKLEGTQLEVKKVKSFINHFPSAFVWVIKKLIHYFKKYILILYHSLLRFMYKVWKRLKKKFSKK